MSAATEMLDRLLTEIGKRAKRLVELDKTGLPEWEPWLIMELAAALAADGWRAERLTDEDPLRQIVVLHMKGKTARFFLQMGTSIDAIPAGIGDFLGGQRNFAADMNAGLFAAGDIQVSLGVFPTRVSEALSSPSLTAQSLSTSDSDISQLFFHSFDPRFASFNWDSFPLAKATDSKKQGFGVFSFARECLA
jgi:hypothetical protein